MVEYVDWNTAFCFNFPLKFYDERMDHAGARREANGTSHAQYIEPMQHEVQQFCPPFDRLLTTDHNSSAHPRGHQNTSICSKSLLAGETSLP
jgi:hypothetical protein